MRTLKDVSQDYLNLCAKAGELNYQYTVVIPLELEKIHNQLFDLAKEGTKLKEAEDLAKKALEPTPIQAAT